MPARFIEKRGDVITDNLHLTCDCSDDRHLVTLTAFEPSGDIDDEYVYLNTFMATDSFWYRLKSGIKYILYGNSDILSETVLTLESQGMLTQFLKDHKLKCEQISNGDGDGKS